MTPRPTAARMPALSGFKLVVIGELFLGIGYVANLLAAQAHASFTLEQGPVILSLIAALWALPAVVLPTVVRRAMLAFGPWRVALWAAALTSVATFVGVFSPSLAPLLAMVLAQGIGRAFALPALDSLPGHLDRDVDERAVSVWLGFATYAPMIVGTLVAALFFDAVGPRAAFAFSAVAYFLCTASIVAVRFLGLPDGTSIADVRAVPATDSRDDGAAGVGEQSDGRSATSANTPASVRSVLRDRPVVAVLAASFLVWITYGAFTAVEIVYVRDVLGVSMAAFAVLQVWHGVGMVLGVVLMFRLGRSRYVMGTLLACIAASLAGELLYVGTSLFVVAAVGCFVWGVASALFGPLIRNALVAARRDDMATTMPLWRASQSLGNLFPMPWIGFLAAGVGAQRALSAVAILAVGSAFAVVAVQAVSARRSASHKVRRS